VDAGRVAFGALGDTLSRIFQPVAEAKGLAFVCDLRPGLPDYMYTDSKRLEQVLKNLLSNGIKFTEQGQVSLEIGPVTHGWSRDRDMLNHAETVIAFTVRDTGIGIPADKHRIIFEAFQQADGTTSRRYGGTGLGLSISREIAHLLGGEIRLASKPGEGSTFTLYLPQAYPGPRTTGGNGAEPASTEEHAGSAPARGGRRAARGRAARDANGDTPAGTAMAAETPLFEESEVPDDRHHIGEGDRVLLIVEDDPHFARTLLAMAREKGFKGLVALYGETGLMLAREFQPDAITLDIALPLMDGWTVLDRLKHDPATRHIPVHIITGSEEPARGLRQGAIAYLQKPVTEPLLSEALGNIKGFVERPVKNLLVVEDDDVQRQSIVELIGNRDVHTTAVGTGADALQALQSTQFDCLVLDLVLPDMTGFALIEKIKKDLGLTALPIVIYTGKELTRQEETQLRRLSDTIIVKDVNSPERLLDETALFLHRVEANLPEAKRQILAELHQKDPALTGKKLLIVDDDIRNIFALTSLLERYDMEVLYAENGKDGIKLLQSTPGVDVVLMDVMMPEMDGYATMQAIRKMKKYRDLPIIALTAKAMKGDRERCIEAGASDYVPKPVDPAQLLSLLRVWLYR
jgi:CheY-like chemotaxis protein